MTLSSRTGSLARIDLFESTNDFSEEPLQEVDRSAEGYPRYTWYEVADADKRYLLDDTEPVFQFDTAGDSNFVAVTPLVIQYPGGRIQLSTARGATDVGRVHTGHYMTGRQFLGASTASPKENWETTKVMLLGDSCQRTTLKYKQWSIDVKAYWANTNATLSTDMTGTDNDITLTHEPGGTVGNSVSLELDDPGGASQPLSVEVSGYDIVVSLATNGASAITTTALELLEALNAAEAVLALGVTCALKTGNDGSGVVTALAHTHLSGGLDPEDYTDGTTKAAIAIYKDYSSDERLEGYCVIPKMDLSIAANELIEQTITIEGYGPLYYRR